MLFSAFFLKFLDEYVIFMAKCIIIKEISHNMLASEKYIFNNLSKGVLLLRRDGELLFINQSARRMLFLDDGLNLAARRVTLENLGLVQPAGVWLQPASGKEMLFTRGERQARLIITTEVKEDSVIVFLEEETPGGLRSIQAESIYPVSVSIVVGIDDAVRRLALKMSKSTVPLVIRGETGTGKEILARAIHLSSPRAKEPFIVVDCCSLPANLIESELFGYEPGAFTGALREGRAGKFELADGGTVFLDEIGDMPLELQPRLLRILNDHQVCRIGSTRPKKVDIRIIAATNKDLVEQMGKGKFREDLYYRLLGCEIYLAPLRQRKKHIDELIRLFTLKHTQGKELVFSDKALHILRHYKWPGNIRELERTIQYLVHLNLERPVLVSDLPEQVKCLALEIDDSTLDLKALVKRFEEKVIEQSLEANGNNITATAQKLGLSRYGLQIKLKKYGILPANKVKKRRSIRKRL